MRKPSFGIHDSFDIETYDLASLLDGIHLVDYASKNSSLNDRLNNSVSELVIAYAPESNFSEDAEYVFVPASAFNRFDYTDVAKWDRMYKTNDTMTIDEYLDTTSEPNISIYSCTAKELVDTSTREVYSE